MSSATALPSTVTPQQVLGNIVGISRSVEAAVLQAAPTVERAVGLQVALAMSTAQLHRALRLRPDVSSRITRFFSCT